MFLRANITVCEILIDSFIFIIENLRSSREGGGVALSALKDLSPAYVCDGGDNVEAITVNIHLKSMEISVTSAYGPQNNALETKKKAFWSYLTEQAHRAKSYGKGLHITRGPKFMAWARVSAWRQKKMASFSKHLWTKTNLFV